MKSKLITGIMLTLLLIGMLTSAFNLGMVGVDGAASTYSSSASVEPPATEWTRTYGGASNDKAHSVVQTSDGGYALAGYTTSYGAGVDDFWLVKTDSSGNVVWNKTYGGASNDYAYSVVQTTDGGYAIAGYTYSFGAGSWDFWLVKTDSNGNLQWNKTYGGTSHDYAWSVVQTVDGGYAIAGWTESYGPGGADFWLVKTDSSGNVVWNKTYGGAYLDEGRSVVQTSDGGYALAGYTRPPPPPGDGEAGPYDFLMVKTDSAGNMLWNRTYGGESYDEARSVVQTSDGGYAIAGWTWSFGAGYDDFWLVKTDATGNLQWNRTYGGVDEDYAHSVVETADGGYALAGSTCTFGAEPANFWLVKTDSAGNLQWNRRYGGAGSQHAFSVVQTFDGGYALAGYTDFNGAGGDDFWLVKVAGGHVYVDPLISYAGIGETFSINVSVAHVANLYGFEFKLSYNTTLLDAMDVSIQPFLNEPTHVFKKEINDPSGFVWVAVTSQYPAEEVHGSGALATVTFQVTGLGGCALDLYDTKLSDPDGFPIDHSVEDGYHVSGMTRVVSTESPNDSWFPSLAVDSSGNVHVAWQDNTDLDPDTYPDIFYKRYEPDNGWTTTEVVSTESTRPSYFPSLGVDSSGSVHVAWQDYTIYDGCGSDFDVFYKRYEPDNGWTTTEVVSTESTGDSEYPSLVVEPDGTVHIAWFDDTNYNGSDTDQDIFYKRYEPDNGWTTTEVVSTESTNGSYHPSLGVDSEGTIHIAWFDDTNYDGSGTDRDIFYKRYEAGVGWTTTEVVSTESTDTSLSPSLGVGFEGTIHVAWHDGTNYDGSGSDWDVFYKRYEPGTGWTTTELISTESTGGSYYPSLGVDLARNVHIAWQDWTDYTGCGTDRDVFYKRYEVGGNWTYTSVVSTESTDHSWYPSLGVDLARNVHIAWQDDTDYAGCGSDTDIFYKYLHLHSTTYPWPMFHHNPRHTGYTESPAPNTNQTQWTYTTGHRVRSSPAVADGKVYVGSNDFKVYCLDASTGAHIWNYTTGHYVQSSPAVADGKVYVGSNDFKVYCLDASTGAHIWNYTTGWYVRSSPAVADGKVYVGSQDDRVYCLDASTGAHIWNYTTGDDVISSPAVADGKVYVGSNDFKVYCLDASTGAHIWNYTTGVVDSSPAVADGKVYVGSADYKVYCLDALSGAHIWNYTTGVVDSSHAVSDGKVYV